MIKLYDLINDNTPKIIIPNQRANIDARRAYKEYIQG